MAESNIPIIDFGPFMIDEGVIVNEDPTEEQLEVAHAIDKACRFHGFLYLTNFGLSKDDRDQIFQASEDVFLLDDSFKKTHLRQIRPVDNMGYSPLRTESHNRSRPPEIKEAFNVRFPPANTNDLRGCPESFQTASAHLRSLMKETCQRYAMACALALGLEPHFFARTMKEQDLMTLRFLHYPPCDYVETTAENNLSRPMRIGEHTDFGLFTILLQGDHGADGLQIKPVQGGEIGGLVGGEEEGSWIDVVVPLQSETETQSVGAIVNTGALMARWTNDCWKASAHRVVVSSQEMARRERYAIAFFADPDSETLVDVPERLVGKGMTKRYAPITSIAYLKAKLLDLGR